VVVGLGARQVFDLPALRLAWSSTGCSGAAAAVGR
jgi:hypothetical protein